MTTVKRRYPRHNFSFKLRLPDGETKILSIPTPVIRARKAVALELTAEHVRESMRLKGVGDNTKCTMAVCARAHKEAFPHPVDGFIEWNFRTAYVVSKTSPVTGMPVQCVVYEHNNNVAQLNDTKHGQQKLLADLEANGPRLISLRPPPASLARTYRPDKPHGKKEASQKSRGLGQGAKRRFAFAELGGNPELLKKRVA